MSNMKLKGVPIHFKYALAANLPLLLLPVALLAASSLGFYTDSYGNNWSGLTFVIGAVYWIPAVLISLIFLAFSVGETKFSKIASIIGSIYGLSIIVFLILLQLFG